MENIMGKSLREIAVEQNQQQKSQLLDHHSKEKTILFVGSKNVGKTTLINHFLEKNEAAKKTLALEYTFARKTGRSLVKDICHLWELGGGTMFPSLIKSTQCAKSSSVTLVLMLDLSELQDLWVTMEMLVNTVRSIMLTSTGSDCRVQESALARIPADHPDKHKLDPFPIPLVIIGGKYDMFQDFEPEKKRIVCRTLRFVAHTLCATLLFYSSKDASLVKRAKDLLSHHAFGTPTLKTISQDYSKPLCVPCGSDLLDSIEGVATTSSWSMDKVKHLFTTHFAQESSKTTTVLEDPGKDSNFREPLIDTLRRQKDEELERYCLEMQRREQILMSTQ